MEKIVNECVGCRDLGLHCMGSSCPNRRVLRVFCDNCGDEITDTYELDGEMLCEDCRRE